MNISKIRKKKNSKLKTDLKNDAKTYTNTGKNMHCKPGRVNESESKRATELV